MKSAPTAPRLGAFKLNFRPFPAKLPAGAASASSDQPPAVDSSAPFEAGCSSLSFLVSGTSGGEAFGALAPGLFVACANPPKPDSAAAGLAGAAAGSFFIVELGGPAAGVSAGLFGDDSDESALDFSAVGFSAVVSATEVGAVAATAGGFAAGGITAGADPPNGFDEGTFDWLELAAAGPPEEVEFGAAAGVGAATAGGDAGGGETAAGGPLA